MAWRTFFALGLCLAISPSEVQGLDAALIFVHGETELLPGLAMNAAVQDLAAKNHIEIALDEIFNVTVKGKIPKLVLDPMCDALGKALGAGKTPLILDMTSGGVAAETVKSFAATLALPTVTTSFGRRGDIKSWHALDPDEERYLVQISPPAGILLDAVRAIVGYQHLPNIAILYSDVFETAFKINSESFMNKMPVRTIMRGISGDLKHQLKEIDRLDFHNYFILGDAMTIEHVLSEANELRYFIKSNWYAATLKRSEITCDCDATIVMMHPEPLADSQEQLASVVNREQMEDMADIDGAFYYDVAVRAITAAQNMVKAGTWPSPANFYSCSAFHGEKVKPVKGFDLRGAISQVDSPWTYAPFYYGRNGESFMSFTMAIETVTYRKRETREIKPVGKWIAGLETHLQVETGALKDMTSRPKYWVVTVEQPPFVMKSAKGSNKYEGLCMDLLANLSRNLGFDYEIYEVGKMGYLNDNGEWSGVVNELLEKRADFAMTAISVMVERERVIDFTMPFYDPVGISILMKKAQAETSLFKFLTVLETDVWLCIMAAYFLTSFLMWVFDRWSPYSYQNNIEKYKDDEEKRIFNLKECLWFCMTSLTPQGGGEAPKNLSGRLVAATWWLFGFIIMASYTANLAAFLTVSRLDTPVESLDDLSKQYKIQYAPLNGSSEMNYFHRMSRIENHFYEIWKDMSLNDSLTPLERSKLAVWDYPVSDKYTKMWQAMSEVGMPRDLDHALELIRNSTSSNEGFALLNDAAENRYLYETNCDLQIVGDEFSRKPYAIALQKGSHLLEPFNQVLQDIINEGGLVKLKEKWWNQVSIRVKNTCEVLKEEEDGISIKNIGGVFIVIVLGIGLAIITLIFEYLWYKYHRNKDSKMSGNIKEGWTDNSASNSRNQLQAQDAASFANKYLDPLNLYGDHFTRRPNAQRAVSNNYYPW